MSAEPVVEEEKRGPLQLLHIVRCPICINVVIDPVTTECGHSLCRACLARYVATTDAYVCPSGCGAGVSRAKYGTSVMLRGMMEATPQVAEATKTRLAEIERDRAIPDVPVEAPSKRFLGMRLSFCVYFAIAALLFLYAWSIPAPGDAPGKAQSRSWTRWSTVASLSAPADGIPSDICPFYRQPYKADCVARPHDELSHNVTVWGVIRNVYAPGAHGGAIVLCDERPSVLLAWSQSMLALHHWDNSSYDLVHDRAFIRELKNMSYDPAAFAAVASCVVVTDTGFDGEYRTCVEFWQNATAAVETTAYRLSLTTHPMCRINAWNRGSTRDHCHCLHVCDDDFAVPSNN